MHVGRRTKRGRAIVVLLLDEDVPDEVMEEVEKAVEADFARHRPVGTMKRRALADGPDARTGFGSSAPVGRLRDDRGGPGVQGQAARGGARQAPEPAAASASRRELDRGQRVRRGSSSSGRARRVRAREMVTVPQGRMAPDRKPRPGPGGHHRGPAWAVSRRGRYHPPAGRLWPRRRAESPPRRGATGRSSTPAGWRRPPAIPGPARRARMGARRQ